MTVSLWSYDWLRPSPVCLFQVVFYLIRWRHGSGNLLFSSRDEPAHLLRLQYTMSWYLLSYKVGCWWCCWLLIVALSTAFRAGCMKIESKTSRRTLGVISRRIRSVDSKGTVLEHILASQNELERERRRGVLARPSESCQMSNYARLWIRKWSKNNLKRKSGDVDQNLVIQTQIPASGLLFLIWGPVTGLASA